MILVIIGGALTVSFDFSQRTVCTERRWPGLTGCNRTHKLTALQVTSKQSKNLIPGQLEMLLLPNAPDDHPESATALARYPQKCNCACALPAEVGKSFFAGKKTK